MNTAATILLGLVLVANVLAWLRGGRGAVLEWWRAKLIGA